MKTTIPEKKAKLTNCLAERQRAANELQNEVNQVLAAALLWVRFAKTENKLTDDPSFYNAETSLNLAIERVRSLHYLLAEELV